MASVNHNRHYQTLTGFPKDLAGFRLKSARVTGESGLDDGPDGSTAHPSAGERIERGTLPGGYGLARAADFHPENVLYHFRESADLLNENAIRHGASIAGVAWLI